MSEDLVYISYNELNALREAKRRALAIADERAKENVELRAERDALVTFFKWAMQEGPWQGGDLDGGGIQDKAESLGLIVSVPYDPEKHGAYNDCGCDAGDPWFEFAPHLPSRACWSALSDRYHEMLLRKHRRLGYVMCHLARRVTHI